MASQDPKKLVKSDSNGTPLKRNVYRYRAENGETTLVLVEDGEVKDNRVEGAYVNVCRSEGITFPARFHERFEQLEPGQLEAECRQLELDAEKLKEDAAFFRQNYKPPQE